MVLIAQLGCIALNFLWIYTFSNNDQVVYSNSFNLNLTISNIITNGTKLSFSDAHLPMCEYPATWATSIIIFVRGFIFYIGIWWVELVRTQKIKEDAGAIAIFQFNVTGLYLLCFASSAVVYDACASTFNVSKTSGYDNFFYWNPILVLLISLVSFGHCAYIYFKYVWKHSRARMEQERLESLDRLERVEMNQV